MIDIAQKEYSWERLRDDFGSGDNKKLFLVSGKGSYSVSGAEDKIDSVLGVDNVVRYTEYQENPSIDDIYNGLKQYQAGSFKAIIAIGGGSAIDTAKSIHLLSEINLDELSLYITGKKQVDKHCDRRAFIAIPTTFGTGSESTHFAVVYIGEKKYSLASYLAMPSGFLLDPELGLSSPKHVKAATGMDALCQATESFWAINSTDESKKYAARAITLILSQLSEFVNNPNLKNASAMAEAAHLAGKAINISKTTAPHALSYAITKMFGTPHGHAVSLTLPYFFELNEKHQEASNNLKELYSLYEVGTAKEAKFSFQKLMSDIGLAAQLSARQMKGASKVSIINELTAKVNLERLSNHPIDLSSHDIQSVLANVFPNTN